MIISESVWLALIPTVPATLAVILGFVNKLRIEENTEKTQDISHKTDVIGEQTDGNLSRLRDEMAVLRDELKSEIGKRTNLENIIAAEILARVKIAKGELEVKVMENMQEKEDERKAKKLGLELPK